jgi:HSP20 family protein
MSLVKWTPRRRWADPFENLLSFEANIDRLFGDQHGGTAQPVYSPRLDVYEEKDNIIVDVDLPGLENDDVSVTVDGDVLTLKGEKKQEGEEKEDGNVYRRERFYGSFQRSLQLPSDIDAEKVNAAYTNGVLRVTLPKSEAAKPKQIAIKG